MIGMLVYYVLGFLSKKRLEINKINYQGGLGQDVSVFKLNENYEYFYELLMFSE